MPDELRFNDPAFSCEVVIRGAHVSLYRAAERQFIRLRSIRDLGLTGHFDETGVHTKYHHLVGLMRLFEKLLMQPEGYGLPRDFLWSFWSRLCFGQTGHAAFCYDAEKAVLLTCHVDASFRKRFVDFLQPVVDEAAKHVLGTAETEKRTVVSKWLDQLIEEHQWRRLFHWISALKLIHDNNLSGLLKSFKYDKKTRTPGFDWQKAILILIEPENEWDHAMRRLNRLDFVVRDLHLTGRIGITLDVDRLVANVNQEDDPDWLLIRQLNDYLEMTLYESEEHQTQSAVFQRTLAELLINKSIGLEQLFGVDANDYISDEDVSRMIKKRKQGRELFDSEVRKGWKTWTINGAVEIDRPPLILERRLAGRRQGNAILTDPSKKRVMVHQLSQPNSIAFSIRHRDASDRPEPKEFLQACKRIEVEMYPDFDVSDLHRTLMEGLCGCSIENSLFDRASNLGCLSIPDANIERAASKYIVKHARRYAPEAEDIKIVIRGVEQPLGFSYPFCIMQASIFGPEDLRQKLGLDLENARRMLWSYMFQWQNRFFQIKPVTALQNLIRSAQEVLHQRVIEEAETKGIDMELYILLESLQQPSENVKFRVSLPNVIIFKEDGTTESEYDVVSVVLKHDNKVEVWIWGSTTEANYSKKRTEDKRKIQILKDKIGQRWSGEIRTPDCYAHVVQKQLQLEIDGRQESR
ncbi:MAG TPA: hypothetical protein VM123_16650 [archaeon]|nr:hypothetical protein [archaeon]